MWRRKSGFCSITAISACFAAYAFILSAGTQAQTESDEQSEPQSAAAQTTDFKKLKSPIPYTKSSIARGKVIFVRHCTDCHGPDGKAQIDVVADATDLTTPKLWWSGTSEGEIFQSIRDGAGVAMPPFKLKIKREENLWHLVNFTRSLWPESARPQLHEKKGNQDTSDKDDENSKDEGSDHEKEG